MLNWLERLPKWPSMVLAAIGLAFGLRGAYNVGGIENVLWVFALAAPGMLCVGGLIFFLRWKLKNDS